MKKLIPENCVEHRWSNSLSQGCLSVLKSMTGGAQERREEKKKKILGRQVWSVEGLLKFWMKETALIHISFSSGNSF